jgi:hypothetical protein
MTTSPKIITPAGKIAANEAAAEELAVLTTLKGIRDGEFISEFDDALQEAINRATDLGKPAKLTVTLDITPAGRTVTIDDDIKPKLPVASKDSTVFFLGEGNKLTRKDPKQVAFATEAGFTGGARPQDR